ncbi:MAG: 30S ribosomal protein S20 [Candidatus Omnitrophota bacterium]|nr:30S ribosomal protein S20 [Candidatus Omnitrophota bacterium]
MPNKKAAIKSLRQDKTKHDRNRSVQTELRTISKKARALITEGNKNDADAALKNLESKLSRAAKNNIIKKKNASRRISRMRSQWAKIGSKA